MSRVLDSHERGSIFDEEYYRTGCGLPYLRNDHWLNFFGGIAEQIIRSLKPRRVFDAGCALGMLVESFWDRGVEAYGVDISPFAISQVRPDMRSYCRVASLTEPIPGKFDLATCIEVLEHMPEAEAKVAIQNLAQAADHVLFSSTPSDFTEPTHINVHPAMYWLQLFGAQGFWPELLYDASFVAPHAILFARGDRPLHPEHELLGLFSEQLRLRSALVEREQRIGRLQQSAEADQEAVKQLTRIERSLADLKNEHGHLQAQVSTLQGERDSLLTGLRNVEQDRAQIQQEMARIIASPGWQAVLRYRNWFWSIHRRSRIFKNWYEPAARFFLNRVLARTDAVSLVADGQGTSVAALAPESASYQAWVEASEPGPREYELQSRVAAQFSYRPKISIVVPVYKIPLQVLKEMVDSVCRQTYDQWELCIAHAVPDDEPARKYLATVSEYDPRIRIHLLRSNEGISENSNRALELCSGEFVALLDHDDTLAPFALYEVARLLNENPDLDFIYSDKDQISEDGLQRMEPLFKPRWSPDLMFSANYLTHFCVVRATEIHAAGGWRRETDGAQDWDLFLRITERTSKIAHIPKVLYHWRRIASSVASRGMEAKPYAAQSQIRAIEDALERRGMAGDIEFTSSGLLRIQWHAGRPAVTVIVVGDEIEEPSFYESLQESANGPVEVWIVPVRNGVNIPDSEHYRKLPAGENASLAERLNQAARQSTGEVLIFLDSSVKPASDEWISELVFPLRDPGVGVVGAKLFDSQSSSIRHAGIAFLGDGTLQYPFAAEHDYVCNEFGSANWYRNWAAVSGACFSTSKAVFLAIGGFGSGPGYPRLDVNYCLNVILNRNLRIQYNPFARMWQEKTAALEQWLDSDETAGRRCFREHFPEGDPYWNSNLTCMSGTMAFQPAAANTRVPAHDFAAEARVLVKMFDATSGEIDASRRPPSRGRARGERRFAWFVPQFENPFYGGIHTILRFADYFQRVHGVRSTFVVQGHRSPARVAGQIAKVSTVLAASSEVRVVGDDLSLDTLPPADASVATLWTTAYYLLRFQRTAQKFYLMQDYEPLFYPAGSTAALVEATYRFGFYGICNTRPLCELYVQHGGEADFFEPCIDPAVFFEAAHRPASKPYVLFCYARPGHSRNCFELLGESLRKVKSKMGDRVVIVTAGEAWSSSLFGLERIVHNLGLLDYRTTGAVYRASDAGVTMMMTCHPSYLPMELMACGSLVISNLNQHTKWLLEDRENCLLAETSPGAIAEVIEEGLRNQALRERLARNAGELIRQKYQNWDAQAEKVYQYIAGKL